MEYTYGPPPNKRMKDLTGMVFGKLKVLGYSHREYRPTTSSNPKLVNGIAKNYWVCKCSCDKNTICLVCATELLSGHTTSCGCIREYNIKNGICNKSHGLSYTRLYSVHAGMISRCYIKNDISYYKYGGRYPHPVKISDKWYTPGVKGNPGLCEFVRWSYEEGGYYDQPKDTPYRDRLSIDRIDGLKGYFPDNCRWIPIWMQASNLSSNRQIWNSSEFVTHSQFERDAGWPQGALYAKYKHGWSYDAIIFAANNPELKMHKFNGVYYDKDGFQHLIRKVHIPGIDS